MKVWCIRKVRGQIHARERLCVKKMVQIWVC